MLESKPENNTFDDSEEGGELHFNIFRGELYINTEIFSEMDPFMILKYGKKKFKTKVLDEAGVNPVWNQEFVFPISSVQDTINIFCYDEDFIIDDFIGLTTMKFEEFNGVKPDSSPDIYYP